MTNPTETRCWICFSSHLDDVLRIDDVPADVGKLADSAAAAHDCPRGTISLTRCADCEFVFNRDFRPELISYSPGFDASLHHSPTHLAFLESLAKRLIERFSLRSKSLAEIGCGSGFFLELLCKLADSSGVGVDPAIQPRELPLVTQCGERSLRFLTGEFDARFRDVPLDWVCCRSVLEHIRHPWHFLRQIRDTLGERNIKGYFELASGEYIFRRAIGWNIFYEQCSYFSLSNFRQLMHRVGFQVEGTGTCFADGNYLFADLSTGSTAKAVSSRFESRLPAGAVEADSTSTTLEAMRRFADGDAAKVRQWQDRLSKWRDANERVAVWGVGGRATMFLNRLDAAVVDCAVDINPARQGKFVCGSGHEVVAPDELKERQPTKIVIMNQVYESEIRRQLSELSLHCDVAIA